MTKREDIVVYAPASQHTILFWIAIPAPSIWRPRFCFLWLTTTHWSCLFQSEPSFLSTKLAKTWVKVDNGVYAAQSQVMAYVCVSRWNVWPCACRSTCQSKYQPRSQRYCYRLHVRTWLHFSLWNERSLQSLRWCCVDWCWNIVWRWMTIKQTHYVMR
jgi:hypothetical protein